MNDTPKDDQLVEESFAALSRHRSILYAWFADLLAAELEPQDLASFGDEAHEGVRRILEQYDPEGARNFFEAILAVPPTREDAIDLKSDFATCFLLSEKNSAPPYASCHLEDKGRLMGQTGLKVKEILQKRKLKVDPGFNEPEDHVSIILAAMADRIMADAELGFSRAAPCQAKLIDELLLSWTPAWADKVAGMDVIHPVYPRLVKLLIGVLRTDRSYLGD